MTKEIISHIILATLIFIVAVTFAFAQFAPRIARWVMG